MSLPSPIHPSSTSFLTSHHHHQRPHQPDVVPQQVQQSPFGARVTSTTSSPLWRARSPLSLIPNSFQNTFGPLLMREPTPPKGFQQTKACLRKVGRASCSLLRNAAIVILFLVGIAVALTPVGLPIVLVSIGFISWGFAAALIAIGFSLLLSFSLVFYHDKYRHT